MYESTQKNTNQLNPAPSPTNQGSVKKIILGILILIALGIGSVMFMSRSDISSTAIKQLALIKKGDIQAAYDMTSKGFKEATTFDVFESYVNSNPIFNDYKKINFTENQKKDDTGYLKGIIEGAGGGQMSAEYQLIREDGTWKILAIRLTPIGVDTSEANMQTTTDDQATTQTPAIHGILVSDEADNDGYVEETKTVVPRSAKKIFATVMIISPTPDINVEASLKHIPSGVILGPIESKTTKTGNIMKAFSFTREKQLWPAGEYEIDVKLSSGDTQSIQFEVN